VLEWHKKSQRERVNYITLQPIYGGLSKSNFKDHCSDAPNEAANKQCLGMIANINEFPVSDEIL